ncbi:hypothetical protein EIN_032020 [Entamoeba invadens IP1]|uniref:Calcineurin-like phosphoesterase domain-containing protein n=1 Tax=Entamoeba invadens IP1 TaxID=370355 RepID=A0A0A1U437_ENTIV|nr:hypothetical protein EIN_032020 [Entamoeba invadens IP1]ELP86451.1 hypothetical protein EIN_032020 [Entamoeba invadens IP1]|eukprot:XP_004185797.1 hypothetical protein EIN_032020 [Entamoeba invadens IP1]
MQLPRPTTFTVISDTHNFHQFVQIQPTDFLIICGDITRRGKGVDSFVNWIKSQQVGNTFLSLGNHDMSAQTEICTQVRSIKNLHLLLNGQITNFGGFQFVGIQYHCPPPLNLSRVLDPHKPLICVSHEPPFGILDYGLRWRQLIHGGVFHAGSKRLRNFVDTTPPLLHCFGHCHSSRGVLHKNGTFFVNASVTDDFGQMKNPPITFKFDGKKFEPTNEYNTVTLSKFIKELTSGVVYKKVNKKVFQSNNKSAFNTL